MNIDELTNQYGNKKERGAQRPNSSVLFRGVKGIISKGHMKKNEERSIFDRHEDL